MCRIVLLIIATVAASAAEPIANYRGDRNGFYADARPPVSWDEASGANIRWKVQMPNWCYGSPVVAGGRVFAMSEPGYQSDFPELVCVDITTGKVLWQKQVNHLEQAIPDAAKRKKVAAAWSSLLERMRIAFGFVHEQWEARVSKDEARLAEVNARIEAMGWNPAFKKWGTFGNRSSTGGYGVLRGWGAGKDPGPDPKHGVSMKELRSYGLRLETFYGFGVAREGEAFPTPVTDGKHIYVVTEQGAHACFDLNGNQMWLTWVKPTFNGGGHDDSICRSPILVDGLFITDLHVDSETRKSKGGPRANPVIALHAETGKIAWTSTLPLDGGRDHGCGSSKVLEVDGTNYFITTGGYVLRVEDGRYMLTCPLEGDPNGPQRENTVDDATDTLFYTPGKGQGMKQHVLVALKLSHEGDALTATEIWRTPIRTSTHTMAVHDGKVYTGADVVDIDTGVVSHWAMGGKKPRIPTRWMIAIADGRLYTLRQGGGKGKPVTGTATVFDITTGKVIATNHLLAPKGEGALRSMRIASTGNTEWGFSYSCNFTFAGRHMFVRSHDFLYCIGKK